MTASTDTQMTPGDLVFLYLAQDGTFDTTTDSPSYGNMLSASTNAGRWQINRIASRSGTDIDLECDLDPGISSLSIGCSLENPLLLLAINSSLSFVLYCFCSPQDIVFSL